MRPPSRRRGQAMVEFALVATAVFMVFLGVFETGRLLAYWISIQQGAQEAARFGSFSANDEAAIVIAARNYTSFIGSDLVNCSSSTLSTCASDTGGVVVSCGITTDATPAQCVTTTKASGGFVRVEITYPFRPVPLVYPFGAIQISSWAQARME
jgi:Flp pilus assembly protein TadG